MSTSRISQVISTTSLGALEGRICQTASERWEIMEERDRLIREERSMKQGVVPVLHADCEDMCPERERYMRQFQRRLSIYEVENVGAREQKVCHSATVKEYSRSSADQVIISPLSVYLNRALLTCHHLATVLSVPVPWNPRVLNRLIIEFWIHFMQRINLSSCNARFFSPRNYRYLRTFDPSSPGHDDELPDE
ncbi:putative germinal-center associated nuclear protein [Apostichopus japonicus]|uniref:Putative germinal-center associated nuclear protein n=1 Tax=Stichopus japonicus TaxID=307972 RepID=A0A2G8KTB6_STIJA|nr:putative germinal-center associated nuclear protein [Apostichopus japonicus]